MNFVNVESQLPIPEGTILSCDLNAKRLDPLSFATEQPNEDCPRNINCREQINQQTQHQRHRKAANWAGAERVKKQRRNNSRHVGVGDRDKGMAETLLDRRWDRLARTYLFPD